MSKPATTYFNKKIHRILSGLNDDQNPIEFFNSTDEQSDVGVFMISPDPNWEGNMYTPVIDEIFNQLVEEDINVMRFSFIKYPTSLNDKYVKYIQQSSICFEEFLKRMPNVKYIIVLGYSFGSLMALQLTLRRIEVMGFICIAPPLLNYDFLPCLTQRNTNGVVIYGTFDPLVPEKVVETYVQCMKSQKMNTTLVPIQGANHYFTNKINLLTKEVLNYINYIKSTPK